MSDPVTDAVIVDGLFGAELGGAGLGAADLGLGYTAGEAVAGTAAGVGAADATFAEMAGWETAGLADVVPATTGLVTGADFGAFGSQAADMMGGNGATGLFSNLAWSDVKPWIGPAMSVGSGLFGMRSAEQMRRMAALAGSRSDPWGTSGGRALADSQLQELLRNPGGVAENDPAYKLRIQGAQRAMGPMGQGSGAMAVAGANASTDWFNQRLAQLGGMAGASANPAAGAYTQMTGGIAANDLAAKSLASIGYGVTRATGGGTALPPAVQERFRQMGFANG